ncbi:MAG: hypothetical protein ACFFCW_02325 [Candidatus Hodarchaeota archaeon]
MNEKKYFVNGAHYKKPWTYSYQIPFFLRVFVKEKPTHILSTGSGRTAFIAFLLAKVLRIKFIYIDTFSRVYGYSKFGSFLLRIGHQILCQWSGNENERARYIGPVFTKVDDLSKNPDFNYTFVAMGTRWEPFTRLLVAVDELIMKGTIKEKVIVQAGHTKYYSDRMELFDFCTPEEIDKLVMNAKYVITQESAGISTKCLRYKTKFLVMPRDYKYGELPGKSDMKEDLHLKLEEMGYTKVIRDVSELENALNKIQELRIGFDFDNSLAIETLNQIMEKS